MNKEELHRLSWDCWLASQACGAKTWKAIRNKAIPDKRGMPCADCGKTATINEHRDYGKWWETDPVCRPCNVRRGRAAPFKHLPLNLKVRRPKFENGHDQFIGQFAASLFHVNDEECADLSAIATENSKTVQAAE